MASDISEAEWLTNGTTKSGTSIVVEDSSTNAVHIIYENIQPEIDAGFGTSAVMKARVKPIGRERIWIGCRQNASAFMASFHLDGSGVVESEGTNVSDSSIIDEGDGSYTCKVIFNGSLTQSNCVFAIGSLITAGDQDFDGNGANAFEVLEAQCTPGTTDQPYVSTGDRETYDDTQTTDGSQDATMPISNRPSNLKLSYLMADGSDPLTITDFAYGVDAFTVVVVCDWDGEDTGIKGLLKHWNGASQNSWRMSLNADGKLQVDISDDGTTTDKSYEATTALDIGDKIMCAFTWGTNGLKLYYNDIELTGSELNKATDGAIGSTLHDSTDSLKIADDHHGKVYVTRLYDGEATASEIASIAGSFGLSGLPDGTNPPVTGGNIPTTLQEMKDYLTGKGVAANEIYYCESGAAGGGDGSEGSPWNNAQTAVNNIGAGQACIFSGTFEESITLQASGTAGNLAWFAGNPEDPAIFDGSEEFSAVSSGAWSDQGSDRWRASYNLTRDWTRLNAYHDTNCGTSPPCIHESVAMAHQMIYDGEQLCRYSQASVPTTMLEGTCYFEVGTGSYETPQYVWVRLPGDVDPNDVQMRNSRTNSVTTENPTGGNHLWDYSDQGNWNGMTGSVGSPRAAGRDYIGMANLHFFFSVDCSRDIGSVNIRGNGWHVEWCSFNEMNAYGFGIYGDGHTVLNCKTMNNGQGNFRGEWLQQNSGTTRIEKCEFRNNNLHTHPIAWEAGQKFSNTGNGGRIEIVDCMFINDITDSRWIGAGGLWWDISNGPNNPADDAYLVERCIFEKVGRWAIFMENNAYHLTLRDCGIFEVQDMAAGGAQAYEGVGIKFSGSGKSTIVQNAIVRCMGAGHHGKTEGGGDTQGQNNNTIERNVYIENATSVNAESWLDSNYIGGPSPTEAWSTSDINDNIFVKYSGSANAFGQNDNGNYSTTSESVTTFEGWHGGTGNVLETDPLDVIASTSNRKTFFDTSGADHPTAGPQNLVHFEDLEDTGWTIPTYSPA